MSTLKKVEDGVPALEEEEAKKDGERDCRDLYCLESTAKCALERGCISCSYKLCLKSSERDRLPENVRPEQCPRIREHEASGSNLYRKKRVLTIGDGDLSFSVAIFRAGAEVYCTTLAKDIDELAHRYPRTSVRSHYTELGDAVFFGVDATKLEEAFPLKKFDRVVFNFPCLDVNDGLDGQSPESSRIDANALEANVNLIDSFAVSAKSLLTSSSEIHLTHKSRPPFSWWRISERFQRHGYIYNGAIVFDRAAFPPYINRKANHRASFPATDALIYIFSLPHAPREATRLSTKIKPTLPPPASGNSLRSDDAISPFYLQDLKEDHDFFLHTVGLFNLLVPLTPVLLAAVRRKNAVSTTTTTPLSSASGCITSSLLLGHAGVISKKRKKCSHSSSCTSHKQKKKKTKTRRR